MSQIDPQTRFLAILELAANATPGPNGRLPPDVCQAIQSLALPPGAPQDAKLSLEPGKVEEPLTYEEAFGSEPPGPGWLFTGEMRWVRGRRRVVDA